MTKTDWTAEEVRTIGAWCQENSSGIYRNSAIAAHMLAHLAERIEADERAVPVAWVDPDDVAEKRKAIMGTADPHEHEGTRYKLPLFTRPPAQEQPGWKVPDSAWPKLELWFFRELTSAQRLALFALHGLPVGEIGESHVNQKRMLRYVLASPTPSKEK